MTASGSCRFRFLVTVAAAALLITAPAADAKAAPVEAVRPGGSQGSAMRTTRPTATVATTFATTTSTLSTTRRRTAWKATHPSGRRPRKRYAASISTSSVSK